MAVALNSQAQSPSHGANAGPVASWIPSQVNSPDTPATNPHDHSCAPWADSAVVLFAITRALGSKYFPVLTKDKSCDEAVRGPSHCRLGYLVPTFVSNWMPVLI